MSDQTSVRVGSIFEYRGASGAAQADPFDLWDFSPAPRAADLSFALPRAETGAPAGTETSLWRIELPADHALAASHLRAGEERLLASQRAMSVAARRLGNSRAATAEAVAGNDAGTVAGNAAGAVAGNAVEEPATADLEFLFGLLKGEAQEVAFGLPVGLTGRWEEINRQFMAFVERVRQTLTHYAWVETRVGGSLLSRTVVSWTGDTTTAFGATPLPPQLALHQRSLALALKSREALLRTFIVIAKGAVLLSSGVGVLALPLIWKYVREVMSELTDWKRMANET